MNDSCRRFDALIARSTQLTTADAAELEGHLSGCDSCRNLGRAIKPVSREHVALVDVDDDWPFVFVASSTEKHEYETKTATLLGQVVALFDQRDCDKVAANLRSFGPRPNPLHFRNAGTTRRSRSHSTWRT